MNPPTSTNSSPTSDVFAAIDMGSNSFRLELAHLHHGRYKRIDYLKETVRLGAGLDDQSMLTEEAIQKGLECLSKFAKCLTGMKAWQIRAVATQTLREARNRDAFLLRAQSVLGHEIEVISGREEARLIFGGVAHLQPSQANRLVIDIGGRSTEMIIGQGHTPRIAESFKVGSVSLSVEYFPEGKFTASAFHAAQIAAGAEFEEAMTTYRPRLWAEALGSSGTAGAVSHILSANGITDGRITPEGLRWCINECLRAGDVHSLDLAGLKPDRKAVLGGGLSILYTLLMQFKITALLPAKGALRQGVIFDLQDRLSAQSKSRFKDLRESSVQALQRRFDIDGQQAARVKSIALQLWANTPVAKSPSSGEWAKELEWACDLHEMGMMVSHHDHHRHSSYLLAHVDAAGFSQSQQRQLANLVLAQRGGLKKVTAFFSEPGFVWQALCLRVAVILSHSRQPINTGGLKFKCRGHQVTLKASQDWVDAQPRTWHLLEIEQETWKLENQLISFSLSVES